MDLLESRAKVNKKVTGITVVESLMVKAWAVQSW
jgi:hypothetical protein